MSIQRLLKAENMGKIHLPLHSNGSEWCILIHYPVLHPSSSEVTFVTIKKLKILFELLIGPWEIGEIEESCIVLLKSVNDGNYSEKNPMCH